MPQHVDAQLFVREQVPAIQSVSPWTSIPLVIRSPGRLVTVVVISPRMSGMCSSP